MSLSGVDLCIDVLCPEGIWNLGQILEVMDDHVRNDTYRMREVMVEMKRMSCDTQ